MLFKAIQSYSTQKKKSCSIWGNFTFNSEYFSTDGADNTRKVEVVW